MKKVILSWSGGKDAAMALYALQQDPDVTLVALFTSVNEHYRRVSMHGVREQLLDKQATAINLSLQKLYLSEMPDNTEYEEKLLAAYARFKKEGITHVAFGDIFLEDLKNYRNALLEKSGLKGLYPLWKKDTKQLAIDFVEQGFEALTCCVSDAFLSKKDVGVKMTPHFFNTLPPGVDTCGENGEYHSFVYAGPLFKTKLDVKAGEKVYRPLSLATDCDTQTRGFWYVDIE